MEDYNTVRKWIIQTLKFHGFTIRSDAADFLAEKFMTLSPPNRNKILENLSDQIRMLTLDTPVVSKEQIEICYKESLLEKPSSETTWNVIDAFQIPCFVFNRERKKYEKNDSVLRKSLLADAFAKSFIKKRLYTSIMHRTLRQEVINQVFTVNGKIFQYSIKNVEWFLCTTEKVEHAVIIGLLVQKADGNYAVEDPTGTLDIDISQAKFADGFFPEHCFVFLEGIYEDKIFYVLRFGLPPAETSKVSRLYFDEMNTFGGQSPYSLTNSKALKKIEEKNPDEMVVFISDIWLDKPQVLEKLNVLFKGYAEFPPFAFVLLGNFISCPKGANYGEELRTGFRELGNIISGYPSITSRSNFVIVPGPSDIGSPKILPRPPISKNLAGDLISKIPKLTLATNPCRIQYCTKEIIVIREELVTKLCRNTLHFPDITTKKLSFHFAKTLLSQGTLAPMSLLVCPIYWNYSHALDLYPSPDLIVASDQFNSFTEKYMGCTITSPGSFVKEKFSFKVYFPYKNIVEDSCLPDDT